MSSLDPEALDGQMTQINLGRRRLRGTQLSFALFCVTIHQIVRCLREFYRLFRPKGGAMVLCSLCSLLFNSLLQQAETQQEQTEITEKWFCVAFYYLVAAERPR